MCVCVCVLFDLSFVDMHVASLLYLASECMCSAGKNVNDSTVLQVVSLCLMPSLLDDDTFPEDAKQRARGILAGCRGGSLGAYSDSPGIEIIRRHVAEYIERRDGHPSCWENIVLCAGASEGIRVRHTERERELCEGCF